ncbi:MAG: hypothetical protein IJ460_04140 [Clostridia bacterium]|nr:hypothetical protein [Clostridia bacterium]
MKRKILSLILTLSLILCQGTLCPGGVYASEDIDPDKPAEEAAVIDRVAWSLEFKNASDIDNFYPSNKTEMEVSHVYGDYMQYTTHSTYINSNGNKAGYFADYRFPAGEELDMDKYYTMQIRMKIVDVDSKAPYKMYIAGTNEDGTALKMAEKNFGTISYDYTSSNGVYSTDWFVLNIDLSSSDHWMNGKTLSQFRPNFIHNAAGTVLIDYIRFIETPGISKIACNSETDADLEDMPVNPETMEIYLTDLVADVPPEAVELKDTEGNSVALSEVAFYEGNLIKLTLAQELAENTAYTLMLKENVHIIGSIYLASPLTVDFSTGTYRIPSIFDIIDPERPSDEIPEGYDNVWSMDFKDESDISGFAPSSKTEIEIKQVYGEYMQYTTKSTYTNNSGNTAGYHADYNFSTALDTDMHFLLQIRMKILEVQDGTGFKMYMKTSSEDGTTSNMAEKDCDNVNYDLKLIDKYYTDGNGEEKQYSGTDWFTLEVDLGSNEKWINAKNLLSLRTNFLHNTVGVVLVDYIRFLGYTPKATDFSYSLDNAETEITSDTYVPASANTFTVGLSHPVSGIADVALTNDFGTKAEVSAVQLDAETKQFVTVTFAQPLEKSSVYTLSITPYVSGSLPSSEPVVLEYKSELEPITVKVNKEAKSASIDYINATEEDVILVAIATVLDGNMYVGKKMAITPLASGAAADDIALDYSSYVSDTTTVEIAIWKYNTAIGKYSVHGKKIY